MKFYKSIVTITIVDTVPLEWNSLRDIYNAANDALMSIAEIAPIEITGKEAQTLPLPMTPILNGWALTKRVTRWHYDPARTL